MKEGSFEVSNKPSRAVEFHAFVSKVISLQKLSAAEAATVCGRYTYADSQLFGRVGRFALAPVSQRAHSGGSCQVLHEELKEALLWLDNWIQSAEPRKVSKGKVISPILVFTDGAVEGTKHDVVTCGSLAFFPETNTYETFGLKITDELLLEWNGGVSDRNKQVIGQAELLPVLISVRLWKDRIKNRDVLFFVDNFSALDALIRGYSEACGSRDILREIAEHDMTTPSNPWYARVPSSSNVGDGPSRLDFRIVEQLPNCTRVYPVPINSLAKN